MITKVCALGKKCMTVQKKKTTGTCTGILLFENKIKCRLYWSWSTVVIDMSPENLRVWVLTTGVWWCSQKYQMQRVCTRAVQKGRRFLNSPRIYSRLLKSKVSNHKIIFHIWVNMIYYRLSTAKWCVYIVNLFSKKLKRLV